MSKREKENEMKTSPKIQAAAEAHRKQVAENDRMYRQMVTAREDGDWAAMDTADYIGKN